VTAAITATRLLLMVVIAGTCCDKNRSRAERSSVVGSVRWNSAPLMRGAIIREEDRDENSDLSELHS
jgi:hypothetical protein